ncbi:MAG: fructoselysine 6-kinase [Firmicutes bacterium]|nr:fructoselysine 6-kinase [Bacillota bacterium]
MSESKRIRIVAAGDCVCDKYLSRGKMYPGGQAVNTCAYASMNGAETAFIGKLGTDGAARCLEDAMDALGIDRSRCRSFEGETGFALVTLKDGDRVFLGSNKGGVAKDNGFGFTEEDVDFIRGFDLLYSDLNSYIEDDLPLLASAGIPVAYDFSTRWDDAYLAKMMPYVDISLMSCAHLTDEEREREMKKAADLGAKIALGTVGEKGSYLLCGGRFYYAEAVKAGEVFDTMGAGDSYFAAFLCSMLESAPEGTASAGEGRVGRLLAGSPEELSARIEAAMKAGAEFAAKVCSMEGAFGFGAPISGRTEI